VDPTPVEQFRWANLTADGVTDMGAALKLVASQLKMPPMDERALPPVLVLVSDGQPTDDFTTGLKVLLDEPWGRRAVRIAIAIGKDAMEAESQNVLQRFIGNTEIKPLNAANSQDLVRYIKWASTAVLKAAVQPPSQTTSTPTTPTSNVPIPEPPKADPTGGNIDDVW
jgi:uncharacterized protein YegL